MAITLNGDTGITLPSGAAPAFSAYASAQQVITLTTLTKVAIDTENFDTNSNFDTSLYRFTPTVAGYYQVTGMVRGSVATTFIACNAHIYKNGSSYGQSTNNGTFAAGNIFTATFSDVIYMNGTTDYLELYGIVNGTGTASFSAVNASATSRFSACLVRSA